MISQPWKVVIAIFVMLTFTSGLGFYLQAILVQGLVDRGFTIEIASSGISVFFFSTGVSGLLISPLLDRIDIRWIVSTGILVFAASLFSIGYIETQWQLYLAYVCFGLGYGATSVLPATALVARWFASNQSRAMSISMTGLSLGGLVMTPMAAKLMADEGLTVTTTWLAVLVVIGVMPVTLAWMRSGPVTATSATGGNLSFSGIDYSSALRQHFFWGFTVLYVLVMTAQVGGISHQYGVLSERLTVTQASLGVAVMPFFSIAGRLLGGLILEFVPTVRFAVIMMLVQGVALVIIGSSHSIYGLYFGLGLFGSAMGNVLMLQALIISEVYGARHYARIFALSNMIMVCGFSFGPFLMGWLQSTSGDFSLPYWFAGSLCFMGAVILSTIRPPVQLN